MGKFEITKRKDGEFQFNLKAANGQVVLTSEGYKAKQSVYTGIASVRKNSQNESKFDKKDSKNKQFYFNLKATNGQVIGTSEMYESESARAKGIDSVKKNAPTADVVELL